MFNPDITFNSVGAKPSLDRLCAGVVETVVLIQFMQDTRGLLSETLPESVSMAQGDLTAGECVMVCLALTGLILPHLFDIQ